jgi:hypothetical protein
VLVGGSVSIWRPGRSTPPGVRRTLLGVAPYSLPDLQLVDQIREAVQQGACSGEQVQVFDVLTCATMEDFDERIPGIGPVYQTPVVGIWSNGILVEKASGARARQLILEHYRLSCTSG